MEDISGSQEVPSDDREWWTSLDEGYWQALMEHGKNPPEAVPPAPVQETFQLLGLEMGTKTPTTSPTTVGSTSPHTEDKWHSAQLALDRGDLLRLRVAGANRGGLLVEWNGLQGFVPASHLVDMPRYQDPHERMSSLADRIGEALTLRLIEVDVPQQRLVFSQRAATSAPSSPLSLLSNLHPGDVCQGTVTNLTTFGAFVDLGGIEGLIHISEISWDRVRHPADALRPGQEVDVYVVGVNPEERRIALSLKRLRPDPWAKVESHYQVGEIVEGTVTNVVNFGAFVRVEEGLEGLIHISELAEGSFMHPRSVVREGDKVQVRVLNINKDDHRLGLSLRQAHGPKSLASSRGLEHGPPA
jgi:small subunit ribosomal protein S1